jgi:predicted methyltransferase MtxX (methanogen marker protein 4)
VRTLARRSRDGAVGKARVEMLRERKRKAALRGAVYMVMVLLLLMEVVGLI